MARDRHPVKAINGRLACLEDWYFLGSTALTLTVDAFNSEGRFVERLALAVTTTEQPSTALTGDVSSHHWWRIVSVSTGTCYALPRKADAPSLTSSTGWALTPDDRIGYVPGDRFQVAATEGGSVQTFTTTTPTVTNATSTTLAAALAGRQYLFIQNNSGANIMVSLSGATLTGIVPTSTNIGLVLVPGQAWESPALACPTGLITGYQTSGGTINTITVMEG